MRPRAVVKLTLTAAEARELQAVAENGYGDGDFYNNPDGTTTRGGRRAEAAYARAQAKLRRARFNGEA